ncbi:MAG TPA: UDP-N-acetylmuramate dehydrogenase, partial [Propionibacteriaceae bacterium]|nr:UDP-N-acetylmuramate dehydrogenase [Propionibacteriaceae bacterium]
SIFKAQAARLVVLSVQFQFFQGQNSLPIRYAELASRLGIEVGQRAPMTQVREVVLALRASKGMVLDEQDHDTWSAGSFFTNPVVDAEQAATLPADAPRFAQPDGTIKTSAAWLIERAGFTRGYGISERVTLSTKHTLAITNRGGASTDDILVLARQVRDGVEARFGVRLQPEPNLVNCSLD